MAPRRPTVTNLGGCSARCHLWRGMVALVPRRRPLGARPRPFAGTARRRDPASPPPWPGSAASARRPRLSAPSLFREISESDSEIS